ncbi:VanZ family protein [Pseudarthrobacter sp. S9]|uniref:VanZ family protein n=1 Tax=Pseudarthrobacter sp. S9 TaxID=3418421 RepID=UPI003CFC52BF
MQPRRAATWGLTAYGLILGVVALWPSPVDRPVAGLLRKALRKLHLWGIPDWVDYGRVEVASNVLLFVPLGALVAWILGMRYWWVGTAAGIVLSGLIELAQLLFLPARFPSLADVAANSLGAMLGGLLALLLMARRKAGRRRQRARTL